jgi:uncharacterized paraquat-inducible protein A
MNTETNREHLAQCPNCDCEITPDLESPEQGVCAVCFIYLQDIQQEQQAGERQLIITREMALNAGFPEIEGQVW